MTAAPDTTAWRLARLARDPRFDGRFFVGVLTTGIYCRPVCPARTPLERNVRYFPSAAAAGEAGLRPCLRCRPEVAPGSPAWNGTSATVRRACRLIDELATDGLTVESLAERLGMGSRHLRRLFLAHVGASPQAVIQTKRLHFAKQLVDGTALPLSEVALASGFGSIRRFNAAFRTSWGRPPSAFRRPAENGRTDPPAFRFRLAYRPPYDWDAMLGFLERRAIPGVEVVREGRYGRSIAVNGRAGWLEVSHDGEGHAILLEVSHPDPRAVYAIVRRAREMFDVDADPAIIGIHLAADPLLREAVRRRPGLRIPGAWDPFEIAVRAVVGQQVSVAAARTLLGRVVRAFGTRVSSAAGDGTWLFPDAGALQHAPLERAGLTSRRAAVIRALAGAVSRGELTAGGDGTASFTEHLGSLPGFGPWTIAYVAMRTGGDPDAFPAADLGLRRAAGLEAEALASRAERWRPWRAYAAMYLWMESPHDHRAAIHDRRQSRRTPAARAQRREAVRAAVPERPAAL